MKKIVVVFPNQLFKDIALLREADQVFLLEEFLFFNQYKFHKQKLVLHRASMKNYAVYLKRNQIPITYVDAISGENDIRIFLRNLSVKNKFQLGYYDVCDEWLQKRITITCNELNIETSVYDSPLYMLSRGDLMDYFGGNKKYFQADFYKQQRIRSNILVNENNKPEGGKWSFDEDNRKKYPSNKPASFLYFPNKQDAYKEAIAYVEKYFPSNYGKISNTFIYPSTHSESEEWLQQFLENRFQEFGFYEDAIVAHEAVLNHSLLTPMLNIGLLSPNQIVEATLAFSTKNKVALNNVEGFIRQVIGWREFIRGVYVFKGNAERKCNYWKFTKKIPNSFYNGTTGIEPIDLTIKKVLETGYCHHIERLMVLGNFMLLCEFDPDEVYRWFMELFIDAYDWVMVPNVYGMSQFADGGMMATKPYISGSNYLMKMSDYKKGEWQKVWDGLFWRFMHVHRDFFLTNPRLGMLLKSFDKMPEIKRNIHLSQAQKYLNSLET